MVKQKNKAQLSLELEQAQKRIAELEQAAQPTAGVSSGSTEQAGWEDEAFYRTFIEQTNDGVVILDEQGDVSFWNSAQENIMGIARDEVIGQKYWDIQFQLSTPETRARLSLETIKEAFQSTFKTGEYPGLGKSREVEIQLGDGSRKFIQISPFTVKTENGYRIGSITRDITEQRRAADVSRENEERFAYVFHASPAQMAITDTSTGKYIDVNEAFLQSLGFTREEVIDKTASELNLFFDPEQRNALLEKMKVQGFLREEVVLVQAKSGELKHGVFSAKYIQIHDRKFLLTVMNDITKLKQMEESLFNNQQNLLETQNVARLQSWTANFQTRVIEIGPEYDHILELQAGVYTLDEIGKLIHAQDRDFVEKAWGQAAQGQPMDIEYRILINGNLKWVHTKIHANPNENEKNISVPGFTQDVTERKQAEELISAQRNLARLASTNTNLEEALPRCLNAALTVSGMDSGGIYLFDTDQQLLNLVYHQGLGADFIQSVSRFAVDAPSVQMVLAGMMLYFTENDLIKDRVQAAEGLQSLAAIPILDHGHTLGCINLGSHTLPRVPDLARQAIETITTEIGTVIAHLQTESLLRDSEEKYRSLINSEESAIYTIDADGIYHYTNRIGAALLAVDANEIAGRKLQDFLPPQIAELQLTHIRAVISSGEGLVTEYQNDTDDKPSWQRVSIQPIHNTTGQITLAMVNSLDITERKQAEKSLQDTRERLLDAQELAHIGNWEWDLKAQALYWSDEVYRIFGVTPAEFKLTVESFENAIHPEDRESFLSKRAKMLEEKQIAKIDHRIILPDGQVRHVNERTQILLDENQNMTRIVGTVQDITERIEAEEALQKSTQILHESQAIANLGSWTADLQTGIFDATPEGARLVGWTPGKHSSDELMDVIHPDDREYMQNAWAAAMHGKPYDIEHRIILNGELRWLRIKAKIKFDELGNPISALGITQDITERKQAEEERRESDDRYRLLFETMVQGVVFQDIEGRIIHANQSAERILGLTLNQMQGRASIDPRWNTIYEDGTPYPGEMHPAMLALRSGESVRNSVLGVYNPAHDSYQWLNVNAIPRFSNGDSKPYQVYTTFEDITERKRAENALASREKQLQTLISSQTHFVIRVNMEGNYVYWNPQFEREFGWVYQPDGMQNANSMKTVCQYHHQRVLAVVQECISQPGHVFSVEIDKPAQDGGIRTTLWEFICITDEHNQPSEIQCMGVEITDRKKAEEALRESEEKYRLLAENISDVIWIMDIESLRFSYVSPSVLQLRGYSADEVLAQDVSASLTPASGQYMAQKISEGLVEFEQGIIKSYTDEIEQPCKDGSTVWTESTTRFVKNPETGKTEVYGVSRNITDRKKAEAAIHQIEKRNTALIEHAPDGIALVDPNGVFMFASPSAYRMFGYGQEEIVGKQSREKVHPQDLHLVANLQGKLLSAPEAPLTIEYRFQHKDGSYHWLESTYTNMFDEPSVNGIVINFRDITDRKVAAEVTRQQGEQLRLLYEASQQLNRTLNVNEIYQTICDFMAIIAPSDTLFISAFDPDTQSITCKAYWMENSWKDVSLFPALPLEEEGKGTQSRVIRSGQAMLLNDYQAFMKTSQNVYYLDDETNEITTEGPEETDEDVTRSAMIVPLKSGGAVKGVIQVASYHLDAYTEDQLKLLEALSLHIASAEQNAQLYTQLVSELNERKQAEEALRASNETAQAILNAATESVFLIETDGTVVAANETTATRLGRQLSSLIGTNIYDSIPLNVAEIRIQQVATLIRDGKPRIFEDERFGVWIENSLYPIFDSEGKVQRVAIYGRDITDRKKMEASLLKSEGLLLEAQRIGRIGHMEWNGRDKKLICSTELYDILGLPHDAVLTQETIGQMMVTEDISTLQQEDEASFKSHKDLNYQYRIHLADGSERWLHQTGKITYGESGAPIRMMAVIQDISERKQTENALRDSEARARAMLQAIPDLMFRMDRQGVFLDYKADDSQLHTQAPYLPLIGKRNRDVAPAEFANLIEREIEKTLETGTLQSFEYKLEVPASGVRDYEARMTPSGQDEVLAVVRDITEQNTARAALRASEEKYRVLIESLDNVVVSVDMQGRVLYLNDMAAGQLDGVAEELIGKNMLELFPEAVVSEQMNAIRQVVKEDKGVIYETRILIQGQPRWYRASIQPIHDEDGRVIQVLINSTDIHDLKTTQQELQDLNRTLEERVQQRTAEVQDLYENSPAGYHSLDASGNIIMINETELKWLGYSREELIGKPILDILTPASIAIFKSNFPAFKQRGWLKDLELEFTRKNGTTMPILVNATAIYDEDKHFTLSRSTVLDNTEHKAADEVLRNANLELARAMRMKDEFLASMSHELRTPLNGILGLSEALQLDVYGPLNEKQKSTLGHVEDSGRHLLELINDILDVSKIEAGKFELEILPCSLGDICQSSIHLTKGMAGKKRQNVNFTMSPASININADARRLKQVLVNLLSNAVKFTPENGSLGMDVTQNEADNIVYISVWDKGIGISTEDTKKLFQPFVQLDSSLSRQQTGTGLGLTLVQRLVEMHGGSIEIQSIPGQGSRFIVALPCLSADSTMENFENMSQSKFNYALIVEDETMDAGHLARYCKALGITPILHSTGKGVIERTIATRPDVVFLDLNLPDISGWDVLTQLKAHPETQHIPVVITSVDDEKQRASQLNVDGYLVKFFAVSDMRAVLANIQKAPSTDETSAPAANQPTATVMIVDDNEINIETVVDYLGSKNLNVVPVQSGLDFLNRVSHIRPDIVLMDIQMPEMDGLETTRRLRAMPDQKLASVPVIALTALAMPGDRELCIEAGADEYVTKPFRLRELHKLIAQMLEEKKRTE